MVTCLKTVLEYELSTSDDVIAASSEVVSIEVVTSLGFALVNWSSVKCAQFYMNFNIHVSVK